MEKWFLTIIYPIFQDFCHFMQVSNIRKLRGSTEVVLLRAGGDFLELGGGREGAVHINPCTSSPLPAPMFYNGVLYSIGAATI